MWKRRTSQEWTITPAREQPAAHEEEVDEHQGDVHGDILAEALVACDGAGRVMALAFAMGWHRYLSFKTIGLNYDALRPTSPAIWRCRC